MTIKEHIEKAFAELFEFANIEGYWVEVVEGKDDMTISPEYNGTFCSSKNTGVKALFKDMTNWIVDAELEDSWPDKSAFNLLIYSSISHNEIKWAFNREKLLIDKRRRLASSNKTVSKYNL